MKGHYNYSKHRGSLHYNKNQHFHKEYDHIICNQYLITFLDSFNQYNKSSSPLQEPFDSNCKTQTARNDKRQRAKASKFRGSDKENVEPLGPNHSLNDLSNLVSNEDLKVKLTLEQARKMSGHSSRRKSSTNSLNELNGNTYSNSKKALNCCTNGTDLDQKVFQDINEELLNLEAFNSDLNDSSLSQCQTNDTSEYERPSCVDQDMINSQQSLILFEEKEEIERINEQNDKTEIKGLEEVLQAKDIHGVSVLNFAITSDNRYIISGFQRSIRIFNINRWQLEHEFKDVHEDSIRFVLITNDDRWIISASNDRSIKVFDIFTKGEIHHFKSAHKDYITSITLSHDGQKLISTSRDKSIKIFNLAKKELEFEISNTHKSEIKSVIISKDSQYVVTGSLNGSIKVFDMINYQPVANFPHIHESAIYGMAITNDSQYLVSVSFDRSINIIDLPNRKLIKQFGRAHEDLISCVVITRDDRYIVTASFDKSIKIVDLATMRIVYHLQNAHMDVINSLALSKGNNYLFAGSMDNSIKMFRFLK